MPRGEDQTTIAVLANEKRTLDEAKALFEQESGRKMSTGEFVKFLAERYLGSRGQRSVVVAQQAEVVTSTPVPPGQMAYLVNCPLCTGQISWPVGLRSGFCPHCHRALTYG
ncbi:MAG: hypothetical protein Q8O40_08040 [Chloroflexota bacterium]|nr:hypothetical protein [Chloroflexota bacterium]